jgi:hypothetical protein
MLTMQGNQSPWTPAGLITARGQAFSRGDFGFIFDSYHSGSNFRRHFTTRDEYLQYGKNCLGRDYQIISCQILAEDADEQDARVICLMEIRVHGKIQHYAELAWLCLERDAWRYHRGLKMTGEELPANRQSLTFADFSKLDPSTIF